MNFNSKIFKLSIVISLLTAYVLPGKSLDGFRFNYGYPFRFFTIYDTPINGDSILSSTFLMQELSL